MVFDTNLEIFVKGQRAKDEVKISWPSAHYQEDLILNKSNN